MNHISIKKIFIFAKKEGFTVNPTDTTYCKVRHSNHFTGKYRGATRSTCSLKHSIPKNIPVVYHNMSNYDYCFIIKEPANKEFKGEEFKYLGENTEKCKIFSAAISKEVTRIGKN